MSYHPTTSQADHVTTRLAMDSAEVIDNFSRAQSLIQSVPEVLFQLDRLVGFYDDQQANELASKIRDSLTALAQAAVKASERPVHPVTWSPDTRSQLIASFALPRSYQPTETSVPESFFEDLSIVD